LTVSDLFKKGNPNIKDYAPKKGSKRTNVPKRSLIARWELERRGINLIDSILNEISKMKSPESRANALIKLLPYVYPSLTAIKLEINKDEDAKLVPALNGADLLQKVKLILERKENEEEGRATSEMGSISAEARRVPNAEGHDLCSGSRSQK
jgi:hypothetical protein